MSHKKQISVILEQLIEDRKSKGIKQCKIAKTLGVDKSLMSRIENGKTSPYYNQIEEYAGYLGYEIRLLKK